MSNEISDVLDPIAILRRIVEIADERPNVPLGQVIEHEVPGARALLDEALRPVDSALAAPDLYQARAVWKGGIGDWMNVSAGQAETLGTEPYKTHYQVRELFERSRIYASEQWLPYCLFTVGVDGNGRVCLEKMWNTHTPQVDYEKMVRALEVSNATEVPAWRAVAADEHPIAARMREEFEAKYGDMAGIAKAVNIYGNVVERFRHGHVEDPNRVTNAALETAEQEMLANIRAEALWLANRAATSQPE